MDPADNPAQETLPTQEQLSESTEAPPASEQPSEPTEMFQQQQEQMEQEIPPAQNDRPDYVPEAFWDAENNAPRLEALAKSQQDWKSKYHKVLNDDSGVPEDTKGYLREHLNSEGNKFVFELAEGQVHEIDIDDPVVQAHFELSHNMNLTRKQSDEYLKGMLTSLAGLQEPVDYAVEEAKLGGEEKGAARVQGMKQYLDGLGLSEMERERLAPAIDDIKSFISQNAERVMVMETIMKEQGVFNLPPSDTTINTTTDDMKEYNDLLALAPTGELDENPIKRARLQELEARLARTGHLNVG